MNIARLFLGPNTSTTLTNVRNNRSVTRTANELRRRVSRLCQEYAANGIRRGDRIVIISSSRIEVLEAILAAFCIGATAMPVGTTIGNSQLSAILQNTRPRRCICEMPLEAPLQELMDTLGIPCLSIAGPDHVAAQSAPGAAAPEETPPFKDLPESHEAFIAHSSGSTGSAKAVVMTHGDLLRFFEFHDFMWRQYTDSHDSLDAMASMVTVLPLAHLAGVALCLQGLLNNRPTFLMSHFLPGEYLQLVEQARCAAMLLVPSMYRSLLKEPYLQIMDRSALRCCVIGGEPCPIELVNAIQQGFGVPVATVFGMTECHAGIGHTRGAIHSGSLKPGSCGRPLLGEVSLRDGNGQLQETFGELWVRNETVHHCYLDENTNAQRLTGGWFRTGDIFYRDDDGEFFHRGRADDMFVCNGKNIYPVEVESVLLRHPGVEAACAVPIRNRNKGTVPGALVVARTPLTPAELQHFCMQHGASHCVPQFLRVVPQLPLLGISKINRRLATEQLQGIADVELNAESA